MRIGEKNRHRRKLLNFDLKDLHLCNTNVFPRICKIFHNKCSLKQNHPVIRENSIIRIAIVLRFSSNSRAFAVLMSRTIHLHHRTHTRAKIFIFHFAKSIATVDAKVCFPSPNESAGKFGILHPSSLLRVSLFKSTTSTFECRMTNELWTSFAQTFSSR